MMELLKRLGFSEEPPLRGAQLYLFTVHLHAMVRCGMGLVSALDVLSQSGRSEGQHVARRLLRDIEAGLKLSQAMNRQPESFPSSYLKVVQTAEETGQMVDCLDRLARTLNQQNATARRLRGALVYPCFLLAASMTLVMVMVYLVFPMVLRVTQDVGVRPPALTQALITVSSPWMLGLVLMAGLAAAGLAHLSLRRPPLRRLAEQFLPPGRFHARLQVLRSTRQLALMLESGVDLLRALGHSGQVGESSLLVREAYAEIVQRTRAGEPLAECFAEHRVFPRSLPGMLSVCAEAGGTHRMLHCFCDMLEEDLTGQVEAATALLEPLMLAGMGVVIGTILIAAFLPIYQLANL